LKDKRVEVISGEIFEHIVVWYLYHKYGIPSQKIDIESFDITAFDIDGKLNTLFEDEQKSSTSCNEKTVLISVKSRAGRSTGVSFRKAEGAMHYGRELGVSKLLYAICFFDREAKRNIKDFEIHLFSIKSAIETAKRLNILSVRFDKIIRHLGKKCPSKILRLDE
jgi:hypothetical protein